MTDAVPSCGRSTLTADTIRRLRAVRAGTPEARAAAEGSRDVLDAAYDWAVHAVLSTMQSGGHISMELDDAIGWTSTLAGVRLSLARSYGEAAVAAYGHKPRRSPQRSTWTRSTASQLRREVGEQHLGGLPCADADAAAVRWLGDTFAWTVGTPFEQRRDQFDAALTAAAARMHAGLDAAGAWDRAQRRRLVRVTPQSNMLLDTVLVIAEAEPAADGAAVAAVGPLLTQWMRSSRPARAEVLGVLDDGVDLRAATTTAASLLADMPHAQVASTVNALLRD